jgi:DNA polymerase III subunit chi
MARVDFHVLKQGKEVCYHYLARLVEKAYLLNNTVFIYTASAADSEQVEDILWVFRDTSFLPHGILEKDEYPAPIQISHSKVPDNKDILLNLTPFVPDFYSHFMRIIELIYSESTIKEQGREKYRKYQQLGCQLHTFIR